MTRLRPASGRLRPLLSEVVAGAFVAACAFAVIGLLLGTGWREYFVRDGDSLALPLMIRSLLSGEPLQWVMTSQLFFFPELPLFAVASLAGDVVASLLLGGVINAVVLFVVVRGIAALVLSDRPAFVRRLAAVGVCLLFLLLCLSEGRALNNDGALAPPFLLTTYYHGSVLVALGCVALTLREIGPDPARGRIGRAAAPVAIVVLTAATTLSNPLFLLHFVGPAVIALLALLFTAQSRARTVLVLLGAILGGSALGYLLRLPLSSFVATDASSYIRTPLAGAALTRLMEQIADVKSTPAGLAELAAIALLLVAATIVVLVRLHRLLRSPSSEERTAPVPARVWFLCVFVVTEAIVLIAVQLATGSTVTRYLMPLAVVPCVVLLVLVRFLPRSATTRPVGRSVAGVVTIGAVAASLLIAAGGAASATAVDRADLAGPSAGCVRDWVGGRDVSGVGSFWLTRPLALYDGLDVQQVNTDFSVQVWMSNLTWYDSKDFSFVLVDPSTQWSGFAEATFGAPASVIDCGEIAVLDYSGTPGEQKLNDVISSSLERARLTYGY